jgi:quinol-cytochrome oxidoreductase complex cytochrome b subunit
MDALIIIAEPSGGRVPKQAELLPADVEKRKKVFFYVSFVHFVVFVASTFFFFFFPSNFHLPSFLLKKNNNQPPVNQHTYYSQWPLVFLTTLISLRLMLVSVAATPVATTRPLISRTYVSV